jgi:hypothetical protein
MGRDWFLPTQTIINLSLSAFERFVSLETKPKTVKFVIRSSPLIPPGPPPQINFFYNFYNISCFSSFHTFFWSNLFFLEEKRQYILSNQKRDKCEVAGLAVITRNPENMKSQSC